MLLVTELRKLSLCGLLSLAVCWAGELRAQAQEVVVATAAVAPWGMRDATGQPTGLLLNFQRELAARSGLTFGTQLSPYPRVIHDLASGNADIGVMFVSPHAEQVGISLGEAVTIAVVALVPASAPDYRRLEDFAGLRVGYVRGSKYGEAFDSNSQFEHVPVTSPEQGLRMLTIDRIDVMVATEQALAYGLYLTGIPANSLKLTLKVGVTRADLYVTRHQAMAPWVPPLKKALAQMRAEGQLDVLFYKHNVWPRTVACFEPNRCLAAQAPEQPSQKTELKR